MLHGPEDLRLGEHQAAAPQLLVQGGAELLRVHAPGGIDQHVPCGEVQHPRRHDLPVPEEGLPLPLEGEEV